VIFLIRSFLIESLFTNRSDITYKALMEVKNRAPEMYRQAMEEPFNQRLVRYAEDPYGGHPTPWEGNTWIADLLPDHPKLALQGLEACMHACRWHLSDNQIWGHGDVEMLIRARFIGRPGSNREFLNVIHEAGWRKLECLAERLYFHMGYDTELTQPSADGGRDVIAKKSGAGEKVVVLIDCKLYTNTVEVGEVRKINGTLADAKANKGVIVTTSTFSSGAREFADRNPLELIDGDHLIPLLNQHLGIKWPLQIDYLCMEAEAPGVHAHSARV
jgi:restriction system protein